MWRCRTPWNVDLAWWLVETPADAEFRPAEAEVASIHWLTLDEMLLLDPLLESNRHFHTAWTRGEIAL